MKVSRLTVVNLIIGVLLLASPFLVAISSSGMWPYDPWWDVNDDGVIDISDLARVSGAFGTFGTNITKASIEYDSGWLNITDKAGQYFNMTHSLDSTDVIFDITGKESSDSEPHQNFYGLTTHIIADPGWSYTYGRSPYDYAFSMVQTSDGGYAMVGSSETNGSRGVWLVKTDAVGNHLWNKTYGGFEYFSQDLGVSVIQTSEGGYAIIGATTDSFLYANDALLIKTDAAGNHLWNKTYGDPSTVEEDFGTSVVQTTDGGYAIAGYTGSMMTGDADFWLIKTDAAGNHLWNKTYGGADFDRANSMIQTADGGYALAGFTYSFSVSELADFWLVKTDADGVMQWNKTYGGTGDDEAWALVQTSDGGYALAGDYDVGEYVYDFWLVKTDAAGNHLWNKTYGGHGVMDSDTCRSVVQTTDGGYTMGGTTFSYGAGNGDAWLVKTDAAGNYLWNKTCGGTGYESAWALVQTSDGGYVIAGDSNSDFWLLKTFGLGEAPMLEVWLAWTASTPNTITLYRGKDDPYWNYVRVRIWKIKDTA